MGDKADYLNRLAAFEAGLLRMVNDVGLDGVLEILESICMDKRTETTSYWEAASDQIASMRGVLHGIILFEVHRAAEAYEKETK
jgi:hypothetical protein